MAAKKNKTTPDAPTEEIEPVQGDDLTPLELDHSLSEGELPTLDPDLPDTPENPVVVSAVEPVVSDVLGETTPEDFDKAMKRARLLTAWAREGRPSRFSYGGKDYFVEDRLDGPEFLESGDTKTPAQRYGQTAFAKGRL